MGLMTFIAMNVAGAGDAKVQRWAPGALQPEPSRSQGCQWDSVPLPPTLIAVQKLSGERCPASCTAALEQGQTGRFSSVLPARDYCSWCKESIYQTTKKTIRELHKVFTAAQFQKSVVLWKRETHSGMALSNFHSLTSGSVTKASRHYLDSYIGFLSKFQLHDQEIPFFSATYILCLGNLYARVASGRQCIRLCKIRALINAFPVHMYGLVAQLGL